MARIHRSRNVARLAPIVTLLVVVGAWQAWTSIGDIDSWVLPAPSSVMTAGWHVRGPLFNHAVTTTIEALLGLAIGTAIGLLVAAVITSTPIVRNAVWPIVVTSQTIPVVALAPLLALWFGYELTPKVLLVALITFFPVAVSTVVGLDGVSREQADLVRSYGANRWVELRYVRVPAALPDFFAGLRIAAAYAYGNAIVGEFIGGSSGLGIFIDRSRSTYRTDQMLAGVIVISVLSLVLFVLVGFLARRAMPWNTTSPQFLPSEQIGTTP